MALASTHTSQADTESYHPSTEDKRLRHLTERGQDLIETLIYGYKKRLSPLQKTLDEHIESVLKCEPQNKLAAIGKLKEIFTKFIHDSEEFINFLRTQRTDYTDKELFAHENIVKSYKSHISCLFEKPKLPSEKPKSEKSNNRSNKSKTTKRSRATSEGTTLSQRKAKAESARIKLEYANLEGELLKQKASLEAEKLIKTAEIEAKLKNLKAEQEVDAVEAEIKVLQEEEDDNQSERSEVPESVVQNHIQRYLSEQAEISTSVNHEQNEQTEPTVDPKDNNSLNVQTTNQNIDIMKCFAKQRFIPDRLTIFSEKTEHYLGWKSTFKDVMDELKFSPVQEMDILINYLGKLSSKQVLSIKTTNSGDLVKGLEKAWKRLDTMYGSPEKIESALKTKLASIPKINYKDTLRLYELSDVLNEINSVMSTEQYASVFAYFNSSVGINEVIHKLPIGIQNKWRDRAISYKKQYEMIYPPFSFFCTFIEEMALVYNDPSFDFSGYDNEPVHSNRRGLKSQVVVRKTSVSTNINQQETSTRCIIHNAGHSLDDCRTFKGKNIKERRELLMKHGHCFRCVNGKHIVKDCQVKVKCGICNSSRHCTIMHDPDFVKAERNNGGETAVVSSCTEICDQRFGGKSCAKIVKVEILHKNSNHPPITIYAVMDEQSNRSLGKKKLFDIFDPKANTDSYKLTTCNGRETSVGRRSSGFIVRSLDGDTTLEMPTIIECDNIPNNRSEIPTPEVANNYSHLHDIADFIPALDPKSSIMLLIGRDMLSAHHILKQKYGKPNEPFAQLLPLGWAIIGESCLDGVHGQTSVTVIKTLITPDRDYNSVMKPCPNKFKFSEIIDEDATDLFRKTENDNVPAMSIEDKRFICMMDKAMIKDTDGRWMAPLPFKINRARLPNNKKLALDRAKNLDQSLIRNPLKREHFVTFMQGLFDTGHIEQAPRLNLSDECWYLPLFGVYHPQKLDRIRGVFDSSAEYQGLSLNKVLMTGPDLMNTLLGVLLRFRKEGFAIMADIEQMFYRFKVCPEHRRYLRFIWHKNNDVDKPLIDYQMNVHVFGNAPSPSVATYGLHRTAAEAEQKFGSDVKEYVQNNFYVDDALSSHVSSDEAIDILQRTKLALHEHGKLRLHKITSNSSTVLSAFDTCDLAKDIKDIDLSKESLPTQRSLGVCWNLQSDTFLFKVSLEEKPFTRRGVLSSINSLFDPLGIAAPVTITGKSLLREAMVDSQDWDAPLPENYRLKWEQWKTSLKDLEKLNVPRMYGNMPLSQAVTKELVIFCDASETAIAAVAYAHLTDNLGHQKLGFIMGKAKLAPKHGHTIPRLELCAAVLATELYNIIRKELNIEFKSVRFFSDSKVVLGYIFNETKRFFTYVANRIELIHKCSEPNQWIYVPSKLNPADEATRSMSAKDMQNSAWLNGPTDFICNLNSENSTSTYRIVEPDSEVRVCKTELKCQQELGASRFERFSSWYKLICSISFLQCYIAKLKSNKLVKSKSSECLETAEKLIVKTVQSESYPNEYIALSTGKPVPRNSSIRNLDPFIDQDGLIRVGGRLRKSNLPLQEKHPVIIPKKHHIAKLLIRHFHCEVKHQGRLLTEGAIRSGGYWIVGAKGMINSYIRQCVPCLKLRGRQIFPKMSDLPLERLEPAPPFTHIGIDVFGPWTVIARKTRGGLSQSKRWAVIFTCLAIRAIHIEVINEMSTSSFINALRRLVALRGEVKMIRSDCGSNFVGAANIMKANIINVESHDLQNFLSKKGITWKFNPPHASHMGGVWERLIGVSRRILDSILQEAKQLTDEVLITFMAEICHIVNSRPIAGVTQDTYFPTPLTPSTLLTLKTKHIVDSFALEEFSHKDLYSQQWKCVQHLANRFWKRWRNEFLSQLQPRRKWQDNQRNLCEGDIVLLQDKTSYRNEWPLAIVERVYDSDDKCVRKVEIRVAKDRKVYIRPASEVILLVANE